jgi:hypothetical protein
VSAEGNKAVLRRWIEAYNERDLEAEAAVLAPDYVAHVPGQSRSYRRGFSSYLVCAVRFR